MLIIFEIFKIESKNIYFKQISDGLKVFHFFLNKMNYKKVKLENKIILINYNKKYKNPTIAEKNRHFNKKCDMIFRSGKTKKT